MKLPRKYRENKKVFKRREFTVRTYTPEQRINYRHDDSFSEYPYDHDLAMWVLRTMPQTYSPENIETWRDKNKMPSWIYAKDKVIIYGVPLSFCIKIMKLSVNNFCALMSVNKKYAYMHWFSEKVYVRKIHRARMEEIFMPLANKDIYKQRKPIQVLRLRLLEKDDTGKYIAAHTVLLKSGHVKTSDTYDAIGGRFISNLLAKNTLEELEKIRILERVTISQFRRFFRERPIIQALV